MRRRPAILDKPSMILVHMHSLLPALPLAIPLCAAAILLCASDPRRETVSGGAEGQASGDGGHTGEGGNAGDEKGGSLVGKTFASMRAAARAAVWFDHNIIDGGLHALGAAGMRLARAVAAVDAHVVDGVPRFLAGSVQFLGLFARQVQSGSVQSYVLCATAAAILMFFLFR